MPDIFSASSEPNQTRQILFLSPAAITIHYYSNMTRDKVFPISVGACISFIVIYVVLSLLDIINLAQSQDSIGEVSRWCERVSSSIFREPTNALSNLGFMFTGLLMLWVLSRDPHDSCKKNQFHGLTPISMLYAGTVIYLGPGSMLMHGTNTGWGGWADNLSMVMYIIIPVSYTHHRAHETREDIL